MSSRRHRLTVALATLALVGAGCAVEEAADPADTTTTTHHVAAEHGSDHSCPDAGKRVGGRWRCDVEHAVLVSRWSFEEPSSAEQLATALRFARRAEATAQQYEDVQAARDAGYTFDERLGHLASIEGTELEEPERALLAAGSVTHLVSEERANDGVAADPEEPDALMYATDGVRYILVGALFLAPVGTDGPQVGGPSTTWHLHNKGDVVCWEGTAAVGFARVLPGDDRYAPTGGCARGAPRAESPQMLHVWFDRPLLADTFNDSMTDTEAASLLEG